MTHGALGPSGHRAMLRIAAHRGASWRILTTRPIAPMMATPAHPCPAAEPESTSPMFTNPIGLAAANATRTCHDPASTVRLHGSRIWDTLTFMSPGPFPGAAVIEALADEIGCTRTHANNCFAAFRAYADACPDDFSGPESRLTRVSNRTYRMDDNPVR